MIDFKAAMIFLVALLTAVMWALYRALKRKAIKGARVGIISLLVLMVPAYLIAYAIVEKVPEGTFTNLPGEGELKPLVAKEFKGSIAYYKHQARLKYDKLEAKHQAEGNWEMLKFVRDMSFYENNLIDLASDLSTGYTRDGYSEKPVAEYGPIYAQHMGYTFAEMAYGMARFRCEEKRVRDVNRIIRELKEAGEYTDRIKANPPKGSCDDEKYWAVYWALKGGAKWEDIGPYYQSAYGMMKAGVKWGGDVSQMWSKNGWFRPEIPVGAPR